MGARSHLFTVAATVSLSSLPATLLDLVGLPARLPGSSLASWWGEVEPPASQWPTPVAEVRQAQNVPADQPVARGDLRSIVHGGFQYIVAEDGREELYRLSSDPKETTNLAGRTEWRMKLEELRRAATRPPDTPRPSRSG